MKAFLLGTHLCAFAIASQTPSFATAHYEASDVVEKDIAIIGGGSAGTYSAIRLKDQGKSVIVIEKKDRIGGHTETYIDPGTGIPVDMGVEIWHNTSTVRDYFARFKIALDSSGDAPVPNQEDLNYDFSTGKEVNVTMPSAADTSSAFATYAQVLQKWPRLNDGMFLPNPVPDELVMPFREFTKKYNMSAIIPTVNNYNPGLGDVFSVPAIEEIRVFGLELIQQLTSFLSTANRNNSELYSKAQDELLAASSLLLESEVQHATRANGSAGVRLMVNTPKGTQLIHAKKLLITIPPRMEFLKPFGLSLQEKGVFGRLIDAGYYASIVKNTGIPDATTITNAVEDTEYNVAPLPGIYRVSRTKVPGLHLAWYGTPRSAQTYTASDEDVKSAIIEGIKNIQRSNPTKFNQTEPEFVAYSSHAPFYLQFRPNDTKAGYYDEMYALQGLRNTYWTGASFRGQDSSSIWRYTDEEVLPKLLEGL